MTPVTALLMAGLLTSMVVGSFYISHALEWFLGSKFCIPLAKRATFMMVALWYETAVVYAVWRITQ